MEKINLQPTTCNLCGGKVVYTSNSLIYGREYGSGRMYYCTNCKAYVGTHIPRPKEAFGILADEELRELKKKCHGLFDSLWLKEKTLKDKKITRKRAYKWLAERLEISVDCCHFGYFDKPTLQKAYRILQTVEEIPWN